MKTGYLKYALAATVAVAATPVFANGLGLNEQTASAAGMAYAGRSSNVLDASTIYSNPAGLSRLNHMQVTVGGAFITAKTDISDATGGTKALGAPSSNNGDMVPDSFVPFGFFAAPLSDRLAFGFGIYAPFGAETDYESTFQGRISGLHSKIQVVSYQPTLSYQVTDRVSVGAGVSINHIKGTLTNASPAIPPVPPAPATPATYASVKGDDTTGGYNLGILVAVTDNLDWGLTYHSKLDFGLTGHMDLSSPAPVAVLNNSYNASLRVTMPESVDTSLTYRLNKWTLSAGATWTRWSQLNQLVITSPSPVLQAAGITPNITTLNWQDTWSWALGAAYQLNPQWVLRAGYAYDPSPTDNANRQVRIPVSDRQSITIGAGWTPISALTVDFAYGHIWEDKGTVHGKAAGYEATYKNTANVFTAQMSYRF